MQYSLILYATTTTRFSKLNQREEEGGGCRCGDKRVPWAAAGGLDHLSPAAARWRLEQVRGRMAPSHRGTQETKALEHWLLGRLINIQ